MGELPGPDAIREDIRRMIRADLEAGVSREHILRHYRRALGEDQIAEMMEEDARAVG